MSDRYIIRRKKVQRLFAGLKLTSLLITNPINVRYLTGFTGNDSWLLLRSDGDVILSDPRFTIQIEEECPDLDAYIRPAGESLIKATAAVLGGTTGRTRLKAKNHSAKSKMCVGVEGESMTLAVKAGLTETVPNAEFISMSRIIEQFRQIKDRNEVNAIRRAIDVAHHAFCEVRSKLGPDWSEIDVRNELEYRIRLHGAEEKSFPSIVGAGARAALPHGVPSMVLLQGQSHLLLDWGALVDGYMSDLTRVLIFSPKNKKLRTIYETVLRAQEAAIKAIQPGKTGEQIDAVARSIIKDAGFGANFNHGLGHAVGLEIHEAPRFAVGQETILKPGMVLTVEPGIYLKDWGGVRIEDNILVTKGGCEVLSRHVPKSFDEMSV